MTLALPALLAAALASGAAGQDPCLSCAPDWPGPIEPTYGIARGEPSGFSVSVGMVFPDVRQLGAPLRTAKGLLVQLEGGSGAGAVRVGPALLLKVGPSRRNVWPVAGVALTASLVRTWDEPAPRPARNYLGPEVLLTTVVRMRFGWLFRLGHPGEPNRCVFSWAVGLGF